MARTRSFGALILAGLTCACSKNEAPTPAPVWTPSTTYATERAPLRGLIDRRGLIHAHSVYSHDACDNKPELESGEKDPVCFDDFREGMCASKHDFVMLSDHRDGFSDGTYPEVLLYRPDQGDTLVMRNARPVANLAACPDGSKVLIMAGLEARTMPVGLEQHVAPREMRSAIYGEATPEAIEMFKENGAVVLLQHTEDWTPETLVELPIDGFEMFNLHANTFLNLGGILEVVLRAAEDDFVGMPHPDVGVIGFISEDPRYLERWGTVLSQTKRVTTMGTDCHRNSFKPALQDGERMDSYRRMMIMLSNHILVEPRADGTWDDSDLKAALRAGRLYGAFEMYGYPVGFDYHARAGEAVHEMGSSVALSSSPELSVRAATIRNLDPKVEAPEIYIRILRAREGGWDEVARGDEKLSYRPDTPGAYRAEVRMRPRHLKPYLGVQAALGEEDRIWIYSNAIYVE